DANGTHIGSVVWFDPQLDFAVIRTNGLAGSALPIATDTKSTGAPGAVLGYPGGGDFNAGPAAILDEFQARGPDIYGNGHTTRDIYEIQAEIVPGNSGGPLVAKDGKVMGVVFAEATSYDHVGYALTTLQITAEINQAAHRTRAVTTGQCAE